MIDNEDKENIKKEIHEEIEKENDKVKQTEINFYTNNKDTIHRASIIIILMLICLCTGFYLGYKEFGENVHNNGNGADAVREQLQDAESGQREEAESIDRATERVERGINASDGITDSISKGIDDVSRGNDAVESSSKSSELAKESIKSSISRTGQLKEIESTDAGIITESQSILERVRERGQEGKK